MIPPPLLMLGVVLLFVWVLFHPRSTAPIKIFLLVAAWMAFGPISEAIMGAATVKFPWRFDYHLYLIDRALGLSAFWVARHFTPFDVKVLFLAYGTLGYWMFLWYGLHLRIKNGRPGQLVTTYLIGYTLAPLFYLMLPACGPRHAFPGVFPLGNPEVAATLVKINLWPNAIPSMHFATAVMLVHFADRNRFWKAFAWIFMAATAGATLALEHYTIDLIVAVPFAYFAISAAGRQWRAALLNLAVVLAWLVSIRFATPLLAAHSVLVIVAATLTSLAGAFTTGTLRLSPVLRWIHTLRARPQVLPEPRPDVQEC